MRAEQEMPQLMCGAKERRISLPGWAGIATLDWSADVFGVAFSFVISHTAENALGCAQSRQFTNHLPFRARVPGNVVAGQHDQIGFQAVSDRDATTDVARSGEGTHVDVGKLGDAKSVESLWQARQPDAVPHDFHILPLIK